MIALMDIIWNEFRRKNSYNTNVKRNPICVITMSIVLVYTYVASPKIKINTSYLDILETFSLQIAFPLFNAGDFVSNLCFQTCALHIESVVVNNCDDVTLIKYALFYTDNVRYRWRYFIFIYCYIISRPGHFA